MQNEKEVKELIQSDKKKESHGMIIRLKGRLTKNFLELALVQLRIKTNWMRRLPSLLKKVIQKSKLHQLLANL